LSSTSLTNRAGHASIGFAGARSWGGEFSAARGSRARVTRSRPRAARRPGADVAAPGEHDRPAAGPRARQRQRFRCVRQGAPRPLRISRAAAACRLRPAGRDLRTGHGRFCSWRTSRDSPRRAPPAPGRSPTRPVLRRPIGSAGSRNDGHALAAAHDRSSLPGVSAPLRHGGVCQQPSNGAATRQAVCTRKRLRFMARRSSSQRNAQRTKRNAPTKGLLSPSAALRPCALRLVLLILPVADVGIRLEQSVVKLPGPLATAGKGRPDRAPGLPRCPGGLATSRRRPTRSPWPDRRPPAWDRSPRPSYGSGGVAPAMPVDAVDDHLDLRRRLRRDRGRPAVSDRLQEASDRVAASPPLQPAPPAAQEPPRRRPNGKPRGMNGGPDETAR